MENREIDKEFPEKWAIGGGVESELVVGIHDENTDYLGYALYHIPEKGEFVAWTFNKSTGSMTAGHYRLNLLDGLEALKGKINSDTLENGDFTWNDDFDLASVDIM